MAWPFDTIASEVDPGQTIQDTHLEALNTGIKTWGGNVNANSNKLTGLATPTSSGDAANKSYVDAAALATTLIEESFTGSTSSSITLSQTPVITKFPFSLYKNGMKQLVTVDYSRTGTAVTLVASRASDDVFEAVYHY